MIATLLGAAGLGALLARREEAPIAPEPQDARSGASSQSLSGDIAWVSWIGDQPDATNLNLRALSGSATLRWVVALGYWSEGDGGGGVFQWDPSGGADDAGTVVVYNQGVPPLIPNINTLAGAGEYAPGRPTGPCWRRVYSGPWDIRWFGAKCAPPVDDSPALALALVALPATGGQLLISGMLGLGPVVPPAPTCEKHPDCPSGYCILGVCQEPSWNGCILKYKSDVSIIGRDSGSGFLVQSLPRQYIQSRGGCLALALVDCQRVQLRGLVFDAGGLATGLLGLNYVRDSIIEDCVFRNIMMIPFGSAFGAVFSAAGLNNVYRGNRVNDCANGFLLGDTGSCSFAAGCLPEAGGGYGSLIEQNCVISGNVLTSISDGGIWFCGTGAVIRENVINKAIIAIQLQWSNYVPIRDVVISRNIISGNSIGIRNDQGACPTLDVVCTDTKPAHRNLTIADNDFSDNEVFAVLLPPNLTGVSITGNLFRNNGSSPVPAIQIDTVKDLSVRGNVFTDTRPTPYQCSAVAIPGGADGVVIAGNLISTPPRQPAGSLDRYLGVDLQPGGTSAVIQNVSIVGNVFRDGFTGVHSEGVHRISVTGNVFADCVNGVAVNGSDVSIAGNVFKGHQFGVRVMAIGMRLSGNLFQTDAEKTEYDIWVEENVPLGEVLYTNGDAFDPTKVKVETYLVAGDRRQKILRATSAPAPSNLSGRQSSIFWNVGDLVYHTSPGSSGNIGWVCTSAGYADPTQPIQAVWALFS